MDKGDNDLPSRYYTVYYSSIPHYIPRALPARRVERGDGLPGPPERRHVVGRLRPQPRGGTVVHAAVAVAAMAAVVIPVVGVVGVATVVALEVRVAM